MVPHPFRFLTRVSLLAMAILLTLNLVAVLSGAPRHRIDFLTVDGAGSLDGGLSDVLLGDVAAGWNLIWTNAVNGLHYLTSLILVTT